MKINFLFLGSILLLVSACGAKKSKKVHPRKAEVVSSMEQFDLDNKESMDVKEIGIDEPIFSSETEESDIIDLSDNEKEAYIIEDEDPIILRTNMSDDSDIEIAIEEPETIQ